MSKQEDRMELCFVEPKDAIRVISESVGLEARRQLLGELIHAWVDEIPESQLSSQYAQAVSHLDHHDLSMLAAWHASFELGQPVPNREFLLSVFPALGDNRREALKIATGFQSEDIFDTGKGEERLVEDILPCLSAQRCSQLVGLCLELYCWDRLGTYN